MLGFQSQIMKYGERPNQEYQCNAMLQQRIQYGQSLSKTYTKVRKVASIVVLYINSRFQKRNKTKPKKRRSQTKVETDAGEQRAARASAKRTYADDADKRDLLIDIKTHRPTRLKSTRSRAIRNVTAL